MPERSPQVRVLRLVQEPQTRLVQKRLVREPLLAQQALAQHFRQEVQPQMLWVLMMLQALGESAARPPAQQAPLAAPKSQ
jgi:hypothetical protein